MTMCTKKLLYQACGITIFGLALGLKSFEIYYIYNRYYIANNGKFNGLLWMYFIFTTLLCFYNVVYGIMIFNFRGAVKISIDPNKVTTAARAPQSSAHSGSNNLSNVHNTPNPELEISKDSIDIDIPYTTTIDIFITHYKENIDILLNSLKHINYIEFNPVFVTVYILDDGQNSQLETKINQLIQDDFFKFKTYYFNRWTDSQLDILHKNNQSMNTSIVTRNKAGNLNYGLIKSREISNGDFIFVLDCDMCPVPNCLQILIQAFKHFGYFLKTNNNQQPKIQVSLVQGLQNRYWNTIQRGSGIRQSEIASLDDNSTNDANTKTNCCQFDYFDSNQTYLNYSQSSLGDLNGCLLLGTNYLITRQSIEDINGYNNFSLKGGEDVQTLMLLSLNNYGAKFINNEIAYGIGDIRLAEVFDTYYRWNYNMNEVFYHGLCENCNCCKLCSNNFDAMISILVLAAFFQVTFIFLYMIFVIDFIVVFDEGSLDEFNQEYGLQVFIFNGLALVTAFGVFILAIQFDSLVGTMFYLTKWLFIFITLTPTYFTAFANFYLQKCCKITCLHDYCMKATSSRNRKQLNECNNRFHPLRVVLLINTFVKCPLFAIYCYLYHQDSNSGVSYFIAWFVISLLLCWPIFFSLCGLNTESKHSWKFVKFGVDY